MNAFERAFLVHPEVFRAGLVFGLLAVTVSLVLREERARLRSLALLYSGSLALRFVAELFHGTQMPASGRTVAFMAVLLQGMAFVSFAVLAVFAFLRRVLRVQSPRILQDLALAVAMVTLLVFLFARNQVDVTGIVATSAVVTAVIGFALQDTLQNLVGGLALQLDGSISVGDWVVHGEIKGIVREITWRHTSVETRDGNTYIVPNSVLIKNPVMLEGKRPGDGFIRERRRLDFHVDRNLLPTDVLAAVRAGFEHDVPRGASEEPAPSVLLMRFGESYNEYQVRYWLSDLAIDDVVDSEVRSRIAYALHRAGIPLAVPAQTITFTSGEDSARRAESGGLAERLAALEALPIFKALGPDEIAALAPRLSRAPYLAGETVVLQGDDVDHLYLLVKGRAEVRVAAPGVGELPIATITGPDLFGEMGVLTGDARRATVVALTELLCFTLSRSMFQEIMKKRPAIAEDFSRILAERERHLLSVLEGASDNRDLEDSQVRLLTRIRRFFGIDEDGGPPDRRDSKAG